MSKPLFVVATMPVGGGSAIVRQWVEAWGDTAEFLPPAADLAERLKDDPRPLLLVAESPATMLAHVLAHQPADNAAAAMHQWSAAASGWMRHLPVRPARWLAVDLDEACRAPQALLQALRESFGLADLANFALVPNPALPALDQLLAAGALARDRALQRQAESLLALCTPLNAAAPATPDDAGRLLASALPALRAVRTAAAKLGGAEQLLQSTQHDLAQKEVALRSGRERLEAIEQENGLLIEQLLRAQVAWEQALAAARSAEAVLAEERSARAAWQAEQTLRDVQQQAEQARLQAEQARLQAEQARLQALLQQASAGRQAAELAAERATETAACAAAAARVGQQRLLCRLAFDGLAVLAEDPTPTHRQLALQLQGLRVDGVARAPLEMRLVEHHGQSGLAWFAALDGSTPFEQWQPHGEEAGRAYMLLLPGDPRTWPAFQTLAATDWHLLLQTAAAAADVLSVDEHHADWGGVARCAAAGVLAMPPVLRFGRANAQGDAVSGEVQLAPASFGSATWSRLSLRWDELNGAAPRLALLEDDRVVPIGRRTWPAAPSEPLAAALAAVLPRALPVPPCADAVPRLLALLAPPRREPAGLLGRFGRRWQRTG